MEKKTYYVHFSLEEYEKNDIGPVSHLVVGTVCLNSRHQAKTIYQHMDEWKNPGRSGPVQMPIGSTQTKDGPFIKEVKIRLAQAHSAMTMLWKKQRHQFPTKI